MRDALGCANGSGAAISEAGFGRRMVGRRGLRVRFFEPLRPAAVIRPALAGRRHLGHSGRCLRPHRRNRSYEGQRALPRRRFLRNLERHVLAGFATDDRGIEVIEPAIPFTGVVDHVGRPAVGLENGEVELAVEGSEGFEGAVLKLVV